MRIRHLVLLLLLCLPARLFAATYASVQNFFPSVDGGPYVTLSGTRTLQKWQYHLGSTFNYSRNPLIVAGTSTIENMLTGDFFGAVGVVDWCEVGLDVPFTFWNASPTNTEMGFGDVRVEPKFRILDIEEQPVGLAALPFLSLPTGAGTEAVGNGSLMGGIRLALDVKIVEQATLGFNVGYLIRDNFIFPTTITERDDSYLLGLGLSVRPHEAIDLIGEISTMILAKDPFGREAETPAEAGLGIRYHTELEGLDLLLGGGAGLTFGFGSPDFRGYLGVTYTAPAEKVAKIRAEPIEVTPAGPPPAPRETLEITRKVHFERAKATLRPVSHPLLDDVIQTLREHPEIRLVEIQGHSDGGGREAANVTMSEKRANAVRQYLIEHGIEAERLVVKGYGSSQPVDSNETELGRARNRRVEFKILEQGEPPPVQPTP